ncbi:MAG: hypothetical protein ACOCQW_06245, partial [Halanaerobiaceae bacterium]
GIEEDVDFKWEEKYSVVFEDIQGLRLGYVKKYEQGVYVGKGVSEFYSDYKKGEYQDSYSFQLERWSQLLDGYFLGGDLINTKKDNFRVSLIAKWLQGIDIKERKYNGKLSTENNRVDFYTDYFYIDNEFAKSLSEEVYPEEFYSSGYSFDINVYLEFDKKHSFEITMKDVYSKINWYNAFTVDGDFNTNNIEEDENGFYKRKPSLLATFDSVNYETQFAPLINVEYTYNKLKAGMNYRYSILKHDAEIKPFWEREDYNIEPYLKYNIIDTSIFNIPIVATLGYTNGQYMAGAQLAVLKIELQSEEFNLFNSKGASGQVSLNLSF